MSKSRKSALAFGVCALVLGGAVLAQSGGGEQIGVIKRADLAGRVVFERQCAPCHGTGLGDDGSPMLAGTQALASKYQGTDVSGALELRSDLSLPVLNLFVRRGLGAMPAFRKSELTDEQLEQIAQYLAATSALNQPRE